MSKVTLEPFTQIPYTWFDKNAASSVKYIDNVDDICIAAKIFRQRLAANISKVVIKIKDLLHFCLLGYNY